VSVARAPGAAPGDALPFEPFELEGSVFARFERIAARFPNRDAVRHPGRVTSYAELRDSSVRLGAAMRERVPEPSRPVALVLETGAPLFSAMLGALAAGRLYAPIDPRLPDARIEAILRELEPGGVLVDADGASASGGRVRALLPGGATPVWTLAELDEAAPRAGASAAGGDAAYVLFTSGSTSRPKGVVQSHRNLLHNVARLTRGVAIGPADRVTLLSSPSFGASVSDVFGALLNGAAVCPYSLSGDGLLRLPAFLAREAITIYHSVPSVFRSLAWTLDGGDDLSSVRTIKLGGEAVLATDFELFRNRFSRGAVFHVGYGATEMNVMRQWFAGHETPWPGASPLGHAVDGVEIVLLNEHGRETALEGEIGVVSSTLAVGYWRDPERTAATFVPVPGRPGVRLYRTGDMGRILPDGCLLHLGRGDARLKVRGHRVETAEVEGELLAVPGVREAAVEGRERDGAVRLAAWVATDGRASLDAPALRRAVAERLPPAMVPTQIVLVAALPRTPGGKVDRRALPDPGATSPGRATHDRAAISARTATDAERAVLGAFHRVLGVEAGLDDDFFDLGGDSLSAIELLVEIGRELGAELSVADLLERATPFALAARAGESAPADRFGPIRLRAGAGRAVFVVPGGGGDGEDLFVARRLARLAGNGPAFYCFRSGPPPHRSVEDLAERCLAQLREADPAGPYSLVGDCVGGVLAFAIAARLREQGERVASLVLLDSPFPTPRRHARSALLKRASWIARWTRRAGYLAARLRHHLRVAAAMPGGRMAYVRRMARVGARGLAAPAGARESENLARRASYVGALMAWTPRRIDASVPVRIVETEDGSRRGFGRAWGGVASDFEVVRLEGGHTRLILDHGDEVAAALRRWLGGAFEAAPNEKTET